LNKEPVEKTFFSNIGRVIGNSLKLIMTIAADDTGASSAAYYS
jgi:hypothetical protein